MIRIKKITTFVCRAPLDHPVKSAVAIYPDRPAVFVRIDDESGLTGWGEIFCNMPPCGAEHRGRLVETVLKPLLQKQPEFLQPTEAFSYLTGATEIMVIKAGEPGPFYQCIAGIDIALWDIWARSQGKPIWEILNPQGNPHLGIYASGLGPDKPEKVALQKQQEGYDSFKLKVGFSSELDLRNVETVRNVIGTEASIMIDANQVWTCDEAYSRIRNLARYDIRWVEEPIRCTQPETEWTELAARCGTPLAAGENLIGAETLNHHIRSGFLRFLQPDPIKWGGFSGLWPVIKAMKEGDPLVCPHVLAGGIALVASAHLLAASPTQGLLEVDVQTNPLRSDLFKKPLIQNGVLQLSKSPGLGVVPDDKTIKRYSV